MTVFDFEKQIPLVTWLDIQRRFRQMTNGFNNFPEFVTAIDCYSDGAEITLTDDKFIDELHLWLGNGFGNALNESQNILTLSIDGVQYPIDTHIQPGVSPTQPLHYPLWQDLAYSSKSLSDEFVRPLAFPANLRISAFHSFKGGVGRTTALITHLTSYLEQTKNRKTKVLLIDADIEAPGITYWLNSANHPSISFVRFLESIHYPASSVESSVKYCASELHKSSILLDGHEIFVLPACVNPRQPTELLDTPVLPEHLARNTKNPWSVGDAIQKLAIELDVELVLIDLRAGFSELASPLLFDPRIERFIVSTVATQSVTGATLVLEKISLLCSLNTNLNSPASVPTVILSLLTPQIVESSDYDEAIQRLTAAFPNPSTNDDISSGIEFVDALFDPNLMCIRDFKQAIELTKNSPLSSQIKSWASTFLDTSPVSEIVVQDSIRSQQARLLEQTCERYIYAENGESENLLITDPIRNLSKHYQDSIPIAISIGAKGAGKTFNFLQLCRLKTWEDFLNKLGVKSSNKKTTLIFPFLSSKNLQHAALDIVRNCRLNCFDQLGLSHEFSENDLRNRIDQAATQENTDWITFWTNELLSAFNVEGNHLKDLNTFLISRGFGLVILIDGLEDQFSTPHEQKSAIKTLLDLPNRIEELRQSHLGIIEFIRSDYVRAVIQQNLGQFESRFIAFSLNWTAESFLRLAFWICSESKLSWTQGKDPATLSTEELLEELYQLWGETLGSVNSKEARTARWVFTALCDLNGRLQARDLVRFLFYAAKGSQSNPPNKWEDRVLSPEAIRRAVRECSSEKVKEAISEINILKTWNDTLQNISEKSVPFDAAEMGLDSESSKALQELGVIFEDRDKHNEEKRFFLPESYRTGLGFTLSSTGGRPRVLALMRRNSVQLPF
ncbi:MAG: ParA family protein [Proteobacteria bacterium]|nr:ParA family protein [Pseudomonadota bacterium]